MKNRVWRQLGLAVTVGALFAVPVYAQEAESETASQETAQESAEDAGAETGLSDELYDFQIQIDDKVYQFPMSYEDFVAEGWDLDDYNDESEQLSPNQYSMIYFNKGEIRCTSYAVNLGVNTITIPECLLGGISIDNFDWDTEEGRILLAGGIQRGVSTIEDIKAAYGNPTDTYEGDLYTKLTYEKDSYCTVELMVYKESGVLEDIDIRNFVEPEGFNAGSVSEEVPADVAAYEAPTELGDDLFSYVVEMDGALYQLPCPASVFVENGWTIDEDNTQESISAKSSGWVAFIKGGNSFDDLARNSEDYATIPENCWIESLSAGDYGMKISMKLPGGIEIGTTEEDLLAVLDAAGISYEKEEGSSYTCYSIGDDSWNGIRFYTCPEEECEIHTPGVIYKIEVSHERES